MRPSRVGWRVRRQAALSPIELRSASVGGDNAPQSTQWWIRRGFDGFEAGLVDTAARPLNGALRR